MRKLLLVLLLMITTAVSAYASKIPDDMQKYVENAFPKTNFRFDGVILLKDGTVYLPLFPAKPEVVENIELKSTIPANK